MEAAILTSDTSQNLFSTPAGAGQTLPAGGSALPFAAVLASQSMAGAQGKLPANQLPFGTAPLQQFSQQSALSTLPIEGADSAVMATWLPMAGGAQPLQVSGDEILVEQLGDEQLGLYSLAVTAEPIEPIAPVGLALTALAEEPLPSGEDEQLIGTAFKSASGQQSGGGGTPLSAALQSSAETGSDEAVSADMAAASAAVQARQQQASNDARALPGAGQGTSPAATDSLGGEALKAAAQSDESGAEIPLAGDSLGTDSDNTVAGTRLPQAATSTGVNANVGSSSTGELEIPDDKSSGAEPQRAPLSSAQVAASVQQAAATQNQAQAQAQSQAPQQAAVAPVATNKVDASANSAKSASPVPVRRQASTESVESTAVDAADGYHWLSDDAVPAVEADVSLTVQAKGAEPSTAQAIAQSAQNTAANTRADGAGSLESFAQIKQSASAEQSAAVQQSAQAEAASLEIETPVRDAQWSQAMAYRVQWMAQQGVQRASVQLNPAELGPMEISVDLADDVAQVQIIAESEATREAVEQAMPRLREMMAQSGFGETAVEISSGNEEPEFQQPGAGAQHDLTAEGGEQGDSSGSARTQEPATAPVSSAERPVSTITSDGRLSFYV